MKTLPELPIITIPEVSPGKNLRETAKKAVFKAKKSGVLPKSGNCADCGVFGSGHNHQAHHDDYTKPFEIIPLCCKCHRKRHKQLGWGVSMASPEGPEKFAKYLNTVSLLRSALRRMIDFTPHRLDGSNAARANAVRVLEETSIVAKEFKGIQYALPGSIQQPKEGKEAA